MTAPQPKRRWLRFSLRALLVLVVLLSVPMGWFAWRMQKARRQREAVEAIMKIGGTVCYDYEMNELGLKVPAAAPATPTWLRDLLGDDFFCDVVGVSCEKTEFGDKEASIFSNLPRLRVLCVWDTEVTDAGIEHVRMLSNLQILVLNGTRVTDIGLEHLTDLAQLERLTLEGTRITDEGLEHLTRLPSLDELMLGDTEITDAGLEEVGRMTGLKWLSLRDTQATDIGLAHLEKLNGLQELLLEDTQVTAEGVKKLQQALPNCEIHY